MAEIKRKRFPSSESDMLAEDSLRWTVVVLFSATLVFACVAATFLEFKSRSAHMAMAESASGGVVALCGMASGECFFEAVRTPPVYDFCRVEVGVEHALGGWVICGV